MSGILVKKWHSLNKQKTRLPKTLKCSKSKTMRHRKLKISNYVVLIRSIWYELFQLSMRNCFGSRAFQSFRRPGFFLFTLCISIMHLCRKKLFYALFLSQILNLRTFLSSGKISTQKSALRKVFNFSASGLLPEPYIRIHLTTIMSVLRPFSHQNVCSFLYLPY